MRSDAGFGLAELLAVVAIVAIGAMVAMPSAIRLGRSSVGAAGARQLATALHALRWQAAATGVAHGMWFEEDTMGWTWRTVVDGNGNGLRTRDLRAGTDRVLDGPHRLEDRTGARFGFPDVDDYPAIPPSTGRISADDPIRIGPTNLLVFSPTGRATSGSLYLTAGREVLFGVVLYGATGRVRVVRFDTSARRWKP